MMPWAFPLDDQCIVPEVNDKVWIYVDQESPEEDYDYNRLYYARFTDTTPLEAYNMSAAESYITKTAGIVPGEPPPTAAVVYPMNRVMKFAGTVMEFDEGNQRFCVTDTHGNYIQFKLTETIIKAKKNMQLFLGAGGKLKIKSAAASMFTFFDDLISAVKDLITPGNIVSPVGPCVFSTGPIHIPKLTALSTKLPLFMEE